MLNPRRLNELAGAQTFYPNYPLSWVKSGGDYVRLAWENRKVEDAFLKLEIPLAFPATYQDQRMIAQRSCFTIHGRDLRPMQEIVKENNFEASECFLTRSSAGASFCVLLEETARQHFFQLHTEKEYLLQAYTYIRHIG